MACQRALDPFPVFARTGTPGDIKVLDLNIRQVADKLIAAINHAKSKPVAKEPSRLRPEDVRFLVYSIIAFRSRNSELLTEDHLQMVKAALGIKRVPARAAEKIGLPPVREPARFLSAAKCQAREPKISVNKHATMAGVDRKTIRAWRKMESFKSEVRTIRHSETSGNGTPGGIKTLDLNVCEVADERIADLDDPKTQPLAKKPKRLMPEDVRFIVYLLAVDRTRERKPLTEDHLRLLAAALGIRRVSLRAAEEIGLPPVKDLATLLTAADLQAREPKIAESRLAAAVGKDRKTIRVWRKLESFNSRVRAIRCLEANKPVIAKFYEKFSGADGSRALGRADSGEPIFAHIDDQGDLAERPCRDMIGL